jgi:hypothetical protein
LVGEAEESFMSVSDATILPAAFGQWLDSNAPELDLGSELAPAVLPKFAEAMQMSGSRSYPRSHERTIDPCHRRC